MAPDLLSGLAGPALFLAAGAGLQAVAPRPLESSFVARLGLAYLLGAAWCALSVWAASFLFGAPVGRVAFVAAGAAAGSAGLFAAAARGDAGGWRRVVVAARRGRWAGMAFGCAALGISGALLADAMLHPVTDFDGRMTWGTLARYIQADRTVLPAAVVDPDAFVVHPRYPVALPLLQVAAAELSGAGLESRAVRPLYALFLPALLAALWPLLRRSGGTRAAALAAAGLGGIPVVLWNQEVGPLGTYSDLPLAAFLGAGLATLLHPETSRRPWRGLIAGLLLAAAAGSKNEGLLLAPAALAAVALVGRASRRRAVGRALAPLAAALTMLLAWRAQIPNRNDEAYFALLSPGALGEGLVTRLPAVLAGVAERLIDPGAWGAVGLLPLVWIAGARGLGTRGARVAAVLLAAQASMVLAAYALTPDLAIVAVTRDRFLLHALAPLALLTAATARPALVAARRPSPRSPAG